MPPRVRARAVRAAGRPALLPHAARDGASSAFHESQSRLWENVVGRSLSTWRFFYPRLQEMFPGPLADVPLEEFHRALNKVAPSTIRVEADEVTYSLHIILRFELERELLAGTSRRPTCRRRSTRSSTTTSASSRRTSSTVCSRTSTGRARASATSRRTRSGTSSRSSSGSGRVSELGDLDAQFEAGEFGPLREWLGENVHRWGRTFEPAELLERVGRRAARRRAVPRVPARQARGAGRRARQRAARLAA